MNRQVPGQESICAGLNRLKIPQIERNGFDPMITGGQPNLVSGCVCPRLGAAGHHDMCALSGEFQCGEEADSGVCTRNQDHFVLHFRSFSLPRAYHRGAEGSLSAVCDSNA